MVVQEKGGKKHQPQKPTKTKTQNNPEIPKQTKKKEMFREERSQFTVKVIRCLPDLT